jgi:hypothetical protein
MEVRLIVMKMLSHWYAGFLLLACGKIGFENLSMLISRLGKTTKDFEEGYGLGFGR